MHQNAPEMNILFPDEKKLKEILGGS